MLELKNISKTFFPGTVHEKTALDNLNLTLNEGDFVTVIGGNGAGKSTMLNAIAGTFAVDSGSIIIDGKDVTRLPEYKRATLLGRVFQDPMMGTAPTMQIQENLALLMAALQKPKLLLLDEHTAALDPRTAAKVLELSDKIVEENHLTTMMITHNMKDAIAHGNRLIMMDAGHVVLDISGEEKKKLTVPDLLTLFSKASGTEANDDKLLLS